MKSYLKHTLTALSFVIVGSSVHAKDFIFQKAGKNVGTYSADKLKKLTPEVEVSIFEPHIKKEITVKALDFRALLDKVFGPEWVKGKTITFLCTDGYRPTLKVADLLKGSPYLALGFKDEKFEVIKDGKKVAAGPSYLVWSDKMEPADLEKHLKAGHWPYQLEQFNLIP